MKKIRDFVAVLLGSVFSLALLPLFFFSVPLSVIAVMRLREKALEPEHPDVAWYMWLTLAASRRMWGAGGGTDEMLSLVRIRKSRRRRT